MSRRRSNIEIIADNYNKLKKMGIIINNINLGGGFPEATVMPQDQLKKNAFEMKKIIESFNIQYENIYFEPGRYFVGDTGIFITKAIGIHDDKWIILNIGNHICPKFARCALRFYNASQISQSHKYKWSIAGIVPTNQDILVKDYFFTESVNRGDIVLILNVGAYSLTFSNRFPYPLPNIFLVKDEKVVQIFNNSEDLDFSIK